MYVHICIDDIEQVFSGVGTKGWGKVGWHPPPSEKYTKEDKNGVHCQYPPNRTSSYATAAATLSTPPTYDILFYTELRVRELGVVLIS